MKNSIKICVNYEFNETSDPLLANRLQMCLHGVEVDG